MSKTFPQNFSAKPARKSLGWELRPENYPMHEPGEWEQNFYSTPQREVSNNRVPPFYPKGGALFAFLSLCDSIIADAHLKVNDFFIFFYKFFIPGYTDNALPSE